MEGLLVTAVGEMQAGPKMEADLKQQNGSLYQDWGGRWQVAAGQGRTSAVLAVAGRVWAPDFYRVAGRTGPRNTMRLGAVTVAREGGTGPFWRGDGKALSL